MFNIRNGVYFFSISLNDGYLEVWLHLVCIQISVYKQVLSNILLFERQLEQITGTKDDTIIFSK